MGIEPSDTEKLASLRKEYELCQSSATALESQIWQSGAIIGLGSVGTLILVSNHASANQPPAFVAILIGALVSLTGAIWWRMARRWWSIQHTKFFRMAQIEPELGYFQTRIVDYLDAAPGDPEIPLSEQMKDLIGKTLKNHQSLGVQWFLRGLPWLIFVGWFLYSIYLLFREGTSPTDLEFILGLETLIAWAVGFPLVMLYEQGSRLSKSKV